ncbi:PadR family transcriptional regulator [Nocardioides sp. ChNu-153]|uniref:PadR family transcriptional regulator n=1 Tax=unclassified Nocardioides TaxID=2615069 RepID=UPI00240745EA|nr:MULTISPECIES: PadR family transcriptional regulator [unclassified Nocardioides]MDF9716177.1 PadR family transcriptional regulator [Nocardioides sp. ChNu-99]MDN7121567.1 PadR family transcriptional regulator [Nocardioides sp. ChNu-153]
MALEHVLLVALRERSGSGLELAQRFERTIGFFWHASHQQVYRTLARMADDGWVGVETVVQSGKPDRKVYAVSPAGEDVLAAWLAEPSPPERLRTEIAVKMRAASYGDREALLTHLAARLADHEARLATFRGMAAEQFPDPSALSGAALDRWLVLRGGLLMEEFWVTWLSEYLTAHQLTPTPADPEETR